MKNCNIMKSGTDTVGHMLMANCSAPMCPESINDYFANDPNSRYPQSAYQATLDTWVPICAARSIM